MNLASLVTVQRAIAATAKTSTDLMELPWPFSQVRLLTADDFLREVDRRRIRLNNGHHLDQAALETLHELGVLVPLFRVDLDAGTARTAVAVEQTRWTRENLRSSTIGQLYAAAGDGRLVDPATVSFQSWPTKRRRMLWPTVSSGYLYSRHQLLGLDQSAALLADITPRRGTNGIRWEMASSLRPDARTLEALNSWRALAISLASIDTVYWPMIMKVISHSASTWRSVRLAHEPHETLTWLVLNEGQVTAQAENLRIAGAFEDEFGDFYDLVRRAKPSAWESLRGRALMAMDYRVAAELLDQFSDDLNVVRQEAPLRQVPLRQQRLSARPASLDAALTRLELSPHPAVVIAVEGKTELGLVPRVMELLGMSPADNRYHIVPFDGTNKDLSLLARYAAQPILGERRQDFVILDRPVTRFLVLTDAENRYRSAKHRRCQRNLLLKAITEHLPAEVRHDLLQRESRIVEIVTWGRLPFEFAHLTDRQLADVLIRASRVPHPDGRDKLIRDLTEERESSTPNVANVFWKGCYLSKVRLHEQLWSVLDRKIRRAIDKGTAGPPIMQALVRAHELALMSHGGTTALRYRVKESWA